MFSFEIIEGKNSRDINLNFESFDPKFFRKVSFIESPFSNPRRPKHMVVNKSSFLVSLNFLEPFLRELSNNSIMPKQNKNFGFNDDVMLKV